MFLTVITERALVLRPAFVIPDTLATVADWVRGSLPLDAALFMKVIINFQTLLSVLMVTMEVVNTTVPTLWVVSCAAVGKVLPCLQTREHAMV